MQNGTGLKGSFSSTQSCIIFAAPGSSTLYYLFTAPETLQPDSLTYNIIDMTLNGGAGAVTVKNVGLLKPATEKLAAVHHYNGIDKWVIGHQSGTADYYAWLVTAAGINPVPVISTAGIVYTGNYADALGYLKVSPCGTMLAAGVISATTLELFDFDNNTGIISHPQLLGSWPGQVNYGPYGVEFSQDNSKLYAFLYKPPVIVQYDLLAGSDSLIIASLDTVSTPVGVYGGALQLAPDGKIYFAQQTTQSLGCINEPNLPGMSCNVTENVISFAPSPGRPGLPNFPSSYFCGIHLNTMDYTGDRSMTDVYPNPASDVLHVSFKVDDHVSVEIVNMIGERVYQAKAAALNSNQQINIPLEGLTSGVYLLKLITERETKTQKFIVRRD